MGKIKNNQKGFTVVEGLIIIVVLAVLGAIGWFVLHGSAASTTTYKNSEFGFQFKYPKSWGRPTSNTIDGKTGKLYQLSWKDVHARAQFATKNYEPVPSKKVVNAQMSLSCNNKESKYVEWLYYDKPSCTSAALWALPNKTVTESVIVVTKKLSSSSKLESIVFAFGPKKNDKVIPDKSALKDIYTDADRQTAIDLAKSIK